MSRHRHGPKHQADLATRRRNSGFSSREEYLEAKAVRRARYLAQGCTDDGQPLADPNLTGRLA